MADPLDILLVEDNPADVRLLKEALLENNSRNRLRVASDGEYAMELLHDASDQDELPDLIVLDLNLPRKSGREVLQEVKTDQHLKRIPVVVLSSSDRSEDVASVYELSGNCYIQKPIEFDRFTNVVKSIEHFWTNIALLPPKAGEPLKAG